MGAQDHPGVGIVAIRLLVVPKMSAVGRSDLDQLRSALGDDVRHPEPAADLHQLAAGDDDRRAFGDRRQGQQHRAGAVVDDHPGLGPGHFGDEPVQVFMARGTTARIQVHFEVGVARRGPHGGKRLRRQRCAAKVGVDHHAGGVDDGKHRFAPTICKPARRGLQQFGDGCGCPGVCQELRPGLVQGCADSFDDSRSAIAVVQRPGRGIIAHGAHGR